MLFRSQLLGAGDRTMLDLVVWIRRSLLRDPWPPVMRVRAASRIPPLSSVRFDAVKSDAAWVWSGPADPSVALALHVDDP